MEWQSRMFNQVYGDPNKDYCISYNPDTSAMGIPSFNGDNGGDETALISKNEGYLILNGDFRKEYEEVYENGYEACKEVFLKHKDDHVSSWSDVK